MKRLAPLVLTAVVVLAPAAPAGARHTGCDSAKLRVTPSHPAKWVTKCSGNATPHVRVNGHDLTIADLSNHQTTATFYGRGSVVRFDQRRGVVRLLAQTTLRHAYVRVWITR